ncbi:MAG: FAD:protein FMN transferase [Bacteroidales bacterium]|nr:FAD:protein FMN transferase [Bacteroidales bacterium]
MKSIFLCLGILVVLAGCHQEQYRTASGATWGTTYHITYKSDSDLSDSIIHEMRKIDMSLSAFEDNSLVSRINGGDSTVRANDQVRDVMALSQQVCSISGGAFDPTVAPLINLWGFGYRDNQLDRPTQEMIDSALATVGIMQCAVLDDGTVVKKTPETEFNFSAVAKGYGVDQVAAMLRRNGCDNYMVEIGGEIALGGKSPRGGAWHIQIDAPIPDSGVGVDHSRLSVIELTDRCIATSGNYRNYRMTADGTVGHTISPVTGMPVATRTLSATIIAPTTALADALATAAMAMPAPDAMEMLQGLSAVDAMLVLSTPDSTYQIVVTPLWP